MGLSDTWIDFIAGWASGAAGVVLLQPVDTVLTRWQAGLVQVGRVNWTGSARALIQDRGFVALWRGSSPMLTTVPLQNAILMTGYGFGQNYAERASKERYTAIFIGGCTGGILQSFLMSPVELVKVSTQCNLQASTFAAASDVIRGLLGQRGWRGLNATLLRDGIPHGVWFVSYEWGKEYIDSTHMLDKAVIPLISGAFAATVAWGVGYPADLIKTRQQAGSPLGVWDIARQIIKEADGRIIQGLYRGFGLKLLRAVPANMIGFSVYEFVKDLLVHK